MNIRKTAIIVGISAIVGLMTGAFLASWYWLNFNARFNTSGLLLQIQADIVTKEAVLKDIRAGRVDDATNRLQLLLDGDLITAGALIRDGYKFSTNTTNAAAAELKAREVSGYAPSEPTVRAAVNEALSLLAGTNTENTQQGAPSGAQKAAHP